jgi:hypothetical protein
MNTYLITDSKYMKQKLTDLKEELDDSTIVPEEFYTQFSIMNISA